MDNKPHQALVVELVKSLGSGDTPCRVYQYIVFHGRMFHRTITTRNPRKHWSVYEAAEIHGRVHRTLLRECKSLAVRGFTLTMPPTLIEVTETEFAESVTRPHRNLPLRLDRVRTAQGVANPVSRDK